MMDGIAPSVAQSTNVTEPAQRLPVKTPPSMNCTDCPSLTADTSLGDVLRHPAFSGFGQLLLPWDDRPVEAGMRLGEVAALLPYHSHIEPAVVVSGLNRLVDDARAGKRVHYDFYSPAQHRSNHELSNTGLFFVRGKPGAPFALIAPGGGFEYVGSLHEGFPYAADIAKAGYNAFVLKYRVGSGGVKATADMAAALTYIVKHADELGVSAQGYSLWGSSAGARMAAAIGTHGAARFGGANLPKPSAVIMAYTGHSEVGTLEPPTFVIVGTQDGIASPGTMKRRVDALRSAGVPVEYHAIRGLPHGFGTGQGTVAAGWILRATDFWARHMQQP